MERLTIRPHWRPPSRPHFFPSRAEIYAPGARLTFFLVRPSPVGRVTSLELGWVYRGDYMNPRTYCVPFYCNSDLYVRNAVAVYSADVDKDEYVRPNFRN